MSRSLIVVGTASHAGKSILTTALCRILKQRGVRVAPFKSQNMALNSYVCSDGSEIDTGPARCFGISPDGVDVTPKPGSLKNRHPDGEDGAVDEEEGEAAGELRDPVCHLHDRGAGVGLLFVGIPRGRVADQHRVVTESASGRGGNNRGK